MKGTSSTNSLRRRGVVLHRGVRCAWLLACLPAVGACHKSSPPGMMTLLPDGSPDVAVVTDGSVRVTVGSNDCPGVTATAGPATARVGSHVTVSAQASDDDPGAQLTYKWTAAAGSFASATAINTTYTCPGAAQAGPQVLTVTVSDGKCSVMRTVTVLCATRWSPTPAAAAAAARATVAPPECPAGQAERVARQGQERGEAGPVARAAPAPATIRARCEGDLCNQCTFGVPDGGTDLCDDNAAGLLQLRFGELRTATLLTSDADRTKCQALYVCVRDNQCFRDLGTAALLLRNRGSHSLHERQRSPKRSLYQAVH